MLATFSDSRGKQPFTNKWKQDQTEEPLQNHTVSWSPQ